MAMSTIAIGITTGILLVVNLCLALRDTTPFAG